MKQDVSVWHIHVCLAKIDAQNIFKSKDVTPCLNETKNECQIAAFVTLKSLGLLIKIIRYWYISFQGYKSTRLASY